MKFDTNKTLLRKIVQDCLGTLFLPFFIITFLCLLSGCASNQTEYLPTFPEVQSRVPMKYPEPKIKFPKTVGIITAQVMEVSGAADLKKVWSKINQKSIPEITRKFWLRNGIRVGIVSLKDIKKIGDALPASISSGSTRMTGSSLPQILLKSQQLTKPIAIYIPSNKKGKTVHIKDGKAQLLAKLTRDSSGRLFLDLTPHHYFRTISLIPKLPLKQRLDGKIYHNLTLRISTGQAQLIVLGLYEPTEKDDAQKHNSSNSNSNNSTPNTNNDNEKPEQSKNILLNVKPVQPSIGSKLFTDNSFGRNLQKLVFINVRPVR